MEDEISALVATIEQDIGPIHVAVYNLGANVVRSFSLISLTFSALLFADFR